MFMAICAYEAPSVYIFIEYRCHGNISDVVHHALFPVSNVTILPMNELKVIVATVLIILAIFSDLFCGPQAIGLFLAVFVLLCCALINTVSYMNSFVFPLQAMWPTCSCGCCYALNRATPQHLNILENYVYWL